MAVALRERSEEGRGESESDSSSLSRLPESQSQAPASRAARSPPRSESVAELGSPFFEFGWRAREASAEESGRDLTDLSIEIAPGRKHDV